MNTQAFAISGFNWTYKRVNPQCLRLCQLFTGTKGLDPFNPTVALFKSFAQKSSVIRSMLSNETKRELRAFSDLFSLVRHFQQAAAFSNNASFLVVFALQLQNAAV